MKVTVRPKSVQQHQLEPPYSPSTHSKPAPKILKNKDYPRPWGEKKYMSVIFENKDEQFASDRYIRQFSREQNQKQIQAQRLRDKRFQLLSIKPTFGKRFIQEAGRKGQEMIKHFGKPVFQKNKEHEESNENVGNYQNQNFYKSSPAKNGFNKHSNSASKATTIGSGASLSAKGASTLSNTLKDSNQFNRQPSSYNYTNSPFQNYGNSTSSRLKRSIFEKENNTQSNRYGNSSINEEQITEPRGKASNGCCGLFRFLDNWVHGKQKASNNPSLQQKQSNPDDQNQQIGSSTDLAPITKNSTNIFGSMSMN